MQHLCFKKAAKLKSNKSKYAFTFFSRTHVLATLHPSALCTVGCAGTSASLDNVEKRKFLTLLGLKLQPPGCLVHTQSLYSLFYPGSQLKQAIK
jgi:hypothetical protein